ncbi:hypothetical protein [Glutamicibacter sp. 2E12]
MTSQTIGSPASITANQQAGGRHQALPHPIPVTQHASIKETRHERH